MASKDETAKPEATGQSKPARAKKAPVAAAPKTPAPAGGTQAVSVEAPVASGAESASGKTQPPTKKIRIRQIGSVIGCRDTQRDTVRGLGLRRMHQVVERLDTPEVRGMVRKIPHLVAIVE